MFRQVCRWGFPKPRPCANSVGVALQYENGCKISWISLWYIRKLWQTERHRNLNSVSPAWISNIISRLVTSLGQWRRQWGYSQVLTWPKMTNAPHPTATTVPGKRHRNCTTRTQYFNLCPYAEECCTAANKGTSAGTSLWRGATKWTRFAHHKKNKAYQIMSITSYLSPKESPI